MQWRQTPPTVVGNPLCISPSTRQLVLIGVIIAISAYADMGDAASRGLAWRLSSGRKEDQSLMRKKK